METSDGQHSLKALPKVRRVGMSERVTCVRLLHPAKVSSLIVSRLCMLLRETDASDAHPAKNPLVLTSVGRPDR